MGRRLAAVALCACLAGCTFSDSLRNDPVLSVWGPAPDAAPARTIFYVTDRAEEGGPFRYGQHWDASLHCGAAMLVVPGAPAAVRMTGEPFAPIACDGTPAMGAFAGRIAAAARGCGGVLVIVHGYNTTFRSGLLRAGQVAQDTGWRCATVLLSWSSAGQFDRYAADVERSGYAVPALMALLRGLAGQHVDILAHSMGNRLTLGALSALCGEEARPLADQVILAAPDVGAEPYNDDFRHFLIHTQPCLKRVTLYASGNDMALILSESVHGGVPRAGREPLADTQYAQAPTRNGQAQVDVIDASLAPGGDDGHGYYALSYEMARDMGAVLAGATLAARLSATDGQGLACRDFAGSSCAAGGGRYMLTVAVARRPDWLAQLRRRLFPLLQPLEDLGQEALPSLR